MMEEKSEFGILVGVVGATTKAASGRRNAVANRAKGYPPVTWVIDREQGSRNATRGEKGEGRREKNKGEERRIRETQLDETPDSNWSQASTPIFLFLFLFFPFPFPSRQLFPPG